MNHALPIKNDYLPTHDSAPIAHTVIRAISTSEVQLTASSNCQLDRLYFNESITKQQSSLFFQGIIDRYVKLNRPFSLVIDSALLADVRSRVSIPALLHSENDTRVVVGAVPYSNIYQKSYKNMKLMEHIKASVQVDAEIHKVMRSFPEPVALDEVLRSVPLPDYTFAGTTELRGYDYSHLFEQVVTAISPSLPLNSLTAFLGVCRENTRGCYYVTHSIYAPILPRKHLHRRPSSSSWSLTHSLLLTYLLTHSLTPRTCHKLAIIGQKALAIVTPWARRLRLGSSLGIPAGYATRV